MKKMKKLCCLTTIIMVAAMSMINVSCSKDETTPELKIPAGSEDYFTKSMDFDTPSAEKKLTFTSNMPWTASVSGSTWLSITPTSGEAGTNTLTVKAEENTTYDDRNAVITVAAGDTIRRVFVNQKQLNALTLTSDRFEVPVEGGEVKIEVKANVNFEAVIPTEYQSWIHKSVTATRGLTTSTLVYKIDKSEEYDKREGKIIIKGNGKEETVTVYQVGSGILTLTKNEFFLDSSAQEVTIEINSNFDYSVDMPNVDWIKEVKAQTRGLSSHTLRLAISENENYDERSAKIRIYDKNSDLSEEVSISQNQKDALLIGKSEYDISSSAQEITIEISSNVDYAVELPEVDWIKEVKAQTRGLSSHTLRLAISENENYDERSAIIKIYNKDSGLSEEVSITQKQKDALIISKNEYLINSSAQEITIEISSNVDYAVELPEVDWIKEVKAQTRGLSSHTLRLEISENENYDERFAIIKIYNKDSGLSEDILITQSQKNAMIIDKKEYKFDEKGGSVDVDVNSNVKFSISIDCDWIAEKKSAATRGLEKTTHTFVVSEMTGNSERVGTITFSDKETGISESVTVTQTRTIYFEIASLDIMEGSEKTIAIINNSDQSITWSSSDESVVTVNNNGKVTAISKGAATITAKTADGKHTCTCSVNVKDITGFITVKNTGGSISSLNGLIQYGSKLNWSFVNNSSVKVHLKSLQLIDGQTGSEGNEMAVDTDVEAGASVGYTTTIGLLGIHSPVTCRFRYEYKDKEYSADAVYKNSSFGF